MSLEITEPDFYDNLRFAPLATRGFLFSAIAEKSRAPPRPWGSAELEGMRVILRATVSLIRRAADCENRQHLSLKITPPLPGPHFRRTVCPLGERS